MFFLVISVLGQISLQKERGTRDINPPYKGLKAWTLSFGACLAFLELHTFLLTDPPPIPIYLIPSPFYQPNFTIILRAGFPGILQILSAHEKK